MTVRAGQHFICILFFRRNQNIIILFFKCYFVSNLPFIVSLIFCVYFGFVKMSFPLYNRLNKKASDPFSNSHILNPPRLIFSPLTISIHTKLKDENVSDCYVRDVSMLTVHRYQARSIIDHLP